MKRFLSCLLVVAMLTAMVLSLASCDNGPDKSLIGQYVYKDSVSTLATNWNPHTYETSDDSYPADFLRVGLYGFVFNDDFSGYEIIPEMAAEKPVDITSELKALDGNPWNIPESAKTGYAYKIKLNPNAVWEDGTAINADTYVESMKLLLTPEYKNYRATDYYAQTLCIAGAENYANQGQIVYADTYGELAFSDLVKGEDGNYYTADGRPMFLGIDFALDWLGGETLKNYVEAYGEAYFDVTNWAELAAAADENGLIPLNDDTYAKYGSVTTGNENWGETMDDVANYFVVQNTYATGLSFDTVGCYKTGDYEIVLVLAKSLKGFYLFYNLSGNWIVKTDLYNACMEEKEGAYVSTYNTSVETTSSYGPYKMTSYQAGKSMTFEKNDKWYGYTDGKHVYNDPDSGEELAMYQTTKVECQVVEEASTRKMMFLKGELMGYGLQAEDFDTYRNSEWAHATPSETIYFLIFNGYVDAINNREAADDFDTATKDLQTMTLTSFRQAVAVTYDKEKFASTVSPARSGGYGLIGSAYIYDPETGARYRDTDQAKKALCDFYSVDVSKYDSLDAAVDSITGYDPETAKTLYQKAFDEAIAAGFITDNDGDGKSDQVVTIEYCLSSDSDFMTKTINYLNDAMAEVTEGTPFEGKISFIKSAPYGNDWSKKLKNGLADTVLGGWSGSALDPFSLSDLYVNPSYQYDAKWFNATSVYLTLDVDVAGFDADENKNPADVKTLTATIKAWSDALNGNFASFKIEGTEDTIDCNFGDGQADVNTRLDILAAIETKVLGTYDYIPVLQDGSMALLSKQVSYVIEDYNPIMGRGGIAYMQYNYDEYDWAKYVAENNGELKY